MRSSYPCAQHHMASERALAADAARKQVNHVVTMRREIEELKAENSMLRRELENWKEVANDALRGELLQKGLQ